MSLINATQSLRDRQISNLKKMLHLNVDIDNNLVSSTNQEELIWKVLILDRSNLCLTKIGFFNPPFFSGSPSDHPNDFKYFFESIGL